MFGEPAATPRRLALRSIPPLASAATRPGPVLRVVPRTVVVLVAAALLGGRASAAPMSGVYTIGGAGADFDSIGHAVDSLAVRGVDGPVTLALRSGTYTEQVAIPPVAGASATNTITFRSESGDRDDVLWQFGPPSAAQSHVVLLDGADHVRLRDLSFSSALPPLTHATIVRFRRQVDDVRIESCSFGAGNLNSLTTALIEVPGTEADTLTHITIANSLFRDVRGGAVRLIATGTNDVGVEVVDNVIEAPLSDYGIYLAGFDSATVAGNTVSVRGMGIRSQGRNRRIECNRVVSVDYGLFIEGGGGAWGPQAGVVANNMIVAGTGNSAAGILLGNNVSGLEVAHNTVYCTEAVFAGGAALGFSGATGPQGPFLVQNNLLVHAGAGTALRQPGSATGLVMDHNNLLSNGAHVANWGGTMCTDLAALQAAGGQNANSTSVDVEFEHPGTDLHLCACSTADPDLRGIGLPGFPADLDGDARSASEPFVGADEPAGGGSDVFGARHAYAVHERAWRFDHGDFDADGDRDIAIATGPSEGPGSVTIGWNDGVGHFTFGAPVPFANAWAWKLVAGNFNPEVGSTDDLAILTTGDSGDSLWVLWSLGDGTFQTNLVYDPVCCPPNDLQAGDVDGDGDLDLCMLYPERPGQPAGIFPLLYVGGSFDDSNSQFTEDTVEDPTWHRLSDVDGDGRLDAVVMDDPIQDEEIAVHLNLGPDGFGEWRGFTTVGVRHDVGSRVRFELGDLDEDFTPDLLGLDDTAGPDSLTVAHNPGDGTYPSRERLSTGSYRTPQLFATLDYELDHDLDIVTLNLTGDLTLLLNDGTGAFQRITGCDETGPIPPGFFKDMFVADLDGDLRPDVAVLHQDGGDDSVSVFLNAGWAPNVAVGDPGVPGPRSSGFWLAPNAANPFRESTLIRFALPLPARVRLTVYDLQGREVARLVDGDRPAGEHRLTFRPTGLAAGVYFCVLRAGEWRQARRMQLIR